MTARERLQKTLRAVQDERRTPTTPRTERPASGRRPASVPGAEVRPGDRYALGAVAGHVRAGGDGAGESGRADAGAACGPRGGPGDEAPLRPRPADPRAIREVAVRLRKGRLRPL